MANPFLEIPSIPRYPDLAQKVVLITGIGQVGTSVELWGNGAATACAFARQGCRVFGCDLDAGKAGETRERVLGEVRRMRGESGVKASQAETQGHGVEDGAVEMEVVQCDVTDEVAVKGMVEKCIERFGRIDVLVNNVGMSMPGTAATMPPQTWQSQLDVNLTSVYNVTHHVLPHMERANTGVILNIASIAALRYIGKPQIAYSATKAAVIQFTKVTAAMYAHCNVRCNVVVPGLMHTPLVEVLAEKYAGGDYEGLVQRRNASVPLGGMGTGWDTANAMLWLGSGSARYVTGLEVEVDGGITGVTMPG